MRWHGKEVDEQSIVQMAAQEKAAILGNPWHRHHALMSFLPAQPSRILDYGCGWGLNSVQMAERGHSVMGIDLSSNEIDLCRLIWDSPDGVEFEHRGIRDIEDASFDAVLSSQVIEHVHNAGNYLSQINRVLRQDGLLIISLPGGVTPRAAARLFRGNLGAALLEFSDHVIDSYDKANDHINSWDQFHFARMLASVGFRVVGYQACEGVPLPRGRYWRTRLKRVDNFCYTMVFSARRDRSCCVEADA